MSDHGKALEAAARAVYDLKTFSPLLIGVGRREWENARPEEHEKAAVFAQAAIAAFLAQREADGFVMVPVGIIEDLCSELEAEVRDRWGFDERLARQLERDMQTVNNARAMLAARPKG